MSASFRLRSARPHATRVPPRPDPSRPHPMLTPRPLRSALAALLFVSACATTQAPAPDSAPVQPPPAPEASAPAPATPA
ncbi:hypothetical protein HMI49_31650, partial [Corallococcus exercitus]|nr:hypothetical protein [Corallococcus exercitus]